MQRPFALPGSRPRYAPDRVVHVGHYRIDLNIQFERRRIEGACTLTVTPILEGVRAIELDAVELEIAKVLREDGAPLAFSHDGRKLRIDLGRALAPGDWLGLTVHYGATPRRGLYFVGPDSAYPGRPRQVWSQGQDEDSRYWFPCFDSPHEKSTSEVIATVPESFFALSNGELVSTSANPTAKTRTFSWRFDVPHSCYLITLAAGELAEIKDRWEDVDVTYYVARGREEEARRALGRTPEMLALFSHRFGVRYPYNKYAQVCVAEFIFGGMENTTATTLTDSCLFDQRAALDYDVEALVAHELAHQWFGDLVTCRDWGQGWLNEGFATYAEYVWRKEAHGVDEADLELVEWAEQYFGEDARRYRRPIVTNVYDLPIDVFDHHLYEKGGLVLHMLRGVLGDGPFWKAIGHYVGKFQAGSVETRDFARAVEEATGRNLDWFFDQWINKAGHPELKVAYSWDADAGLASFTVKQAQKVDQDTPLFRLPIEVRFRVGDRDEVRTVMIEESHHTFHFALEAAPSQAIFDSGQVTLKKAEVTKPQPLWIAELACATRAIDRVAAARALGKETAADAVNALEQALREDPFWGVGAAAAEALGAIRSHAARDVLLRALGSVSHPKTRRAVAKALGEFRHDDVAAAALEQVVLHGDESYFVEAEACLALGRTRAARARPALRAALGRDSYLDIVRQHAFRGLAEARDDTAIPLLLEGTQYGKVSQGRRAAVLALGELAKGRRDREARDVRERLEELLFDPDFRVKMTVVETLGTVGDPAAVDSLRRLVELDLDGRVKRRGREVIRDLEDSRPRDEAMIVLKDEVDKLRQELVGLREQLAKLESRRDQAERTVTKPTVAKPRASRGSNKPPARRTSHKPQRKR